MGVVNFMSLLIKAGIGLGFRFGDRNEDMVHVYAKRSLKVKSSKCFTLF